MEIIIVALTCWVLANGYPGRQSRTDIPRTHHSFPYPICHHSLNRTSAPEMKVI